MNQLAQTKSYELGKEKFTIISENLARVIVIGKCSDQFQHIL
jgi:hypothetical protein